MERYTRPLGLKLLVLNVQDTFSSQMGQMGVSLGGKADICRNDGWRGYTGLEVILAMVRADIAE